MPSINLDSSLMTTVCTVLLLVYQLNKRTTIQMAEEIGAQRHVIAKLLTVSQTIMKQTFALICLGFVASLSRYAAGQNLPGHDDLEGRFQK